MLRKAALLHNWPSEWYWADDTLTSAQELFDRFGSLRNCDLLTGWTKTFSAADRVL
jgi:hypothetical protein